MNPQNTYQHKAIFDDKLRACSDEQLAEYCDRYIWLAAYAHNNPHSAYHWMCDACYDEAVRRDRVDIYTKEHKRLVREAS